MSRRDLPKGLYWSGKNKDKIQAKIGLPGGRQVGRSFSVTQEKDALEWREAAQRAVQEGRPIPEPGAREPAPRRYELFRDVLEEALEFQYAGAPNPQTIVDVRNATRQVILPALGNMPVGNITTPHVDAVSNELYKRYKPQGARRHESILRTALEYAHSRGIIDRNPGATPPRRRRRAEPPVHIYVSLEAAHVIAARVPPETAIAVWIQRLCGLRIGEVYGLEDQDVDLEEQIITMTRQGGRKTPTSDERLMTHGLKHGHRIRRVAIPDQLVDALSEHRSLWVPSTGSGPSPRFIPPTPRGIWTYCTYYTRVSGAAREAGVVDPATGKPARPHDLRRSMITDLDRAGVDSQDVSRIAGHRVDQSSTSRVTYTHYVVPRPRELIVQRRAVRKLEETLREDGLQPISVSDPMKGWTPAAEAAAVLGVSIDTLRKQGGDGRLVMTTLRPPGRNAPSLVVLTSSLDARIEELASRVSNARARELLGIDQNGVERLQRALKLQVHRGNDGNDRAWVSRQDFDLMGKVVDDERAFLTKHIRLREAAMQTGIPEVTLRRWLDQGILKGPAQAPDELYTTNSRARWIARSSLARLDRDLLGTSAPTGRLRVGHAGCGYGWSRHPHHEDLGR